MSPVIAQRTNIVTLHPCLLNAGNVKKMKWTVGKMKNVAQGRRAPGADVQKAWSLALAEQDVILRKNNAPLGSVAPKHKVSYSFPVCIPFPSEGEQCHSQTRSLLNVITYGEDYGSTLNYCPCTEGLVCSSRGNLISTCEKPEDIMDFTNYRDDSLFQPVVRREAELTYYDSDLVPWPGQDDQLAFIGFPRAAGEAEAKTEQLNVGMNDNLEEGNLQLYDHGDKPDDPGPVDFQELKRLASEMGQYFGASFY
ncbi:uncharacterized protein LOC143933889 isoform X2 [Lithobates pipiens]